MAPSKVDGRVAVWAEVLLGGYDALSLHTMVWCYLGRSVLERSTTVVASLPTSLQRRVQTDWVGDDVHLVPGDMRNLVHPPPEKADIFVSELLGSFGDNELSPECLDGAQHMLKGIHALSFLHILPEEERQFSVLRYYDVDLILTFNYSLCMEVCYILNPTTPRKHDHFDSIQV